MNRIYYFAFSLAVTFATVFGASLLNRESSKRNSVDSPSAVSFKVAKDTPRPRKRVRQKKKKKLKNIKQAPVASPNMAYVGGLELEMPQMSSDPMAELFKEAEAPVVPPHPSASNSPPTYPLAAREGGTQGRVIAFALVDEYGYVVRARITSSDPKGVFDDAVLAAVKTWKFSPATIRGEPVEQWVEIPFNFVL